MERLRTFTSGNGEKTHPSVDYVIAALPPLLCFGAFGLTLAQGGVAGWMAVGAFLLAAVLGFGVGGALASRLWWRTSTPKPLSMEELFDTFMEHLPGLASVKDQSGRYLYVSQGCRSLLGRNPEEMVGRSDAELWPMEIAELIGESDRRALKGQGVITTTETIRLGDEQRSFAVSKFAIRQPDHGPLVGSIAFDISDRIRAEEDRSRLEQHLIQSQKMEAIGTLASGIAHDFNNILGAIFGYVELAKLDCGNNDRVLPQLDQVLQAGHRAKELVRQILTFSRKQEQDRRPLDLKPLINEALILLRASLPSTIEIRSDLHNDGALVLADATQMHQVIMNLCTNAAHAMESGGGVMTVGLKKHRLTSNEETLGRGLAPGTYVEIVVQDTGHGISASVKKRIFEPYFTTKAPGKGTGMGLAVVHGIIKGHGGAINVHSEPGTGSRFSILLPSTERAIPISRVIISALPRGDESLLFVDDEAFLVDLGRQMLTRLGYRVTCSTNPLDALEALRREPQRFDLLITDMTMPHMTGEILARQCRMIRPDLPAILCTGYSRQIETERFGQLGFASLLMKPLTIGDLARTIRKALDGRNGSREMGSAFINEIHQGQAPAVNE